MDIQTIIQGGGVGVAVLAVVLLYKLSSNHIDHNTRALTKLEAAIDRLIDLLEKKL